MMAATNCADTDDEVLWNHHRHVHGWSVATPAHSGDDSALLNLLEAKWELEEIFGRAVPASSSGLACWSRSSNRGQPMAAEEHDNIHDNGDGVGKEVRVVASYDDDDDELAGPSSSFIAESYLPRLGFSPQSMVIDDEQEPLHRQQSLRDYNQLHPIIQLVVTPPSRARNPVPLNTPFQASFSSGLSTGHLEGGFLVHGRGGSGFLNRNSPFAYAESFNRPEQASCALPGSAAVFSSTPLVASASPTAVGTDRRSSHMRNKRNRSYSDSMIKRDQQPSDTTPNSLVLVS